MSSDAVIQFQKAYSGTPDESYFETLAELDQPPPPDDPHDEVHEPIRFLTPEESRPRISEAHTRPNGRVDGFPEPEDVGLAEASPLADVEYVEDVVRPGRITVVAAEEGTGKSYAFAGELAVRVARAGGTFAGTWPVLGTAHVLVLSEMHIDDDLARLDAVCSSLSLDRSALAGSYWRLALATAANGLPALSVPEWRKFIVSWARQKDVRLVIIDTATGAADVDPWGKAIQAVYRELRAMLAEYPELAIVLVVHLKKPQANGQRRLSDVLGEWGRWCDIVMLMEADGAERVKLSVRKRVRHERMIVVTKRGGLLVEPHDPQVSGPKVPQERVLATITANPGIDADALAALLGVTTKTVRKYVVGAGEVVRTVEIPLHGAAKRVQYFPVAREAVEDAGNEPTSHATSRAGATDSPFDVGSRKPPIEERRVLPSTVGEGGSRPSSPLPLEDDYPASALDVDEPDIEQLPLIVADMHKPPAVPTDMSAMVPHPRKETAP